MKIIGVTGGSGSGKTIFCDYLAACGAVVIDADLVYWELLRQKNSLLADLRAAFGPDIFFPDGSLDRKALGRIVFADKPSLARLNAIAIPYVLAEIEARIDAIDPATTLLVLNAPTLYESGTDTMCERVYAITSNADLRIKRICMRDDVNELYAALRINAQPKDSFYAERGAVLIENDGDVAALQARAAAVYKELGT